MQSYGNRARLAVYLEPDLYDWIHRQAAAQERSMSAWMRWVVIQLRAGLDPGTMGGHAPAAANDE